MNYIAGFKVTIFNLLCLLVVEDVSPIASAIICEILAFTTVWQRLC